ncbi:hypothetical protein JRO89_XSUnG0099000 [Xanthoceras sorbifolium]|uniref:Uncharacterized protein n=1 Tax=Xanthoceras sorbifolium TaxID=99658 RepID=A0ABQ8GYQ8_9ROSI|nr:hypothetical protein JRO89_XSUnG0099000 [Xanthoceras sorbifolium]
MSFIASSSTSREAWLKLGHLYANRSRSRIIYLKEKLSLTTRGTKPVTEFIQNLKSIADQLALAGAPLDEDHLIIHCLNGIGPEFKEISAAVRAREQSISFETLHDKLILVSLHSEYDGPDGVALGDGSGLDITHVGEGFEHGAILLRGPNRSNAYEWPTTLQGSSSSKPVAFVGVKLSAYYWHRSLGHPSSPVLEYHQNFL